MGRTMLLAIFFGQLLPTASRFREIYKFHGIIKVGESKLVLAIFKLAWSPIHFKTPGTLEVC